MHSIINWIKSNKLLTILILFAGYTLLRQPIAQIFYNMRYGNRGVGVSDYGFEGMGVAPSGTMSFKGMDYAGDLAVSRIAPEPYPNATPQPDITDRMMVKNANQSLLVSDVRSSMEGIEKYAKDNGGYVVNKYLNTPEESSSGNITVRVPSEKLEDALKYFGENSVRVVYESVSGTDITDQYEDTKAQLEILEKTKTIFDGMLTQATNFDQILRAQQEILNVQRQIDNIKGRMMKMEATAETSLISIDMSTDELELGYAPADAWRPRVVLKRAVRALIADSRKLGNFAIWASVYSIYWIPAIGIFLLIRKKTRAKKENQ